MLYVDADAAPDPTAAHKALSSGPVLLSEADGKKLLSQELKSGKDLIQTPFGNLPSISEKVLTLCCPCISPVLPLLIAAP
jgi:hypothetical protein